MRFWAGLVLAALLAASPGAVVPAAAEEWREAVPMTSARAFSAGALSGEDIFVVGGAGITEPKDAVEIYDVIGDIWRSGPALPEGVQQAAIASLGDVVYVTGGFLKDSDGADNARLWILDPRRGFWVEGPPMPGPRAMHGMAALDGKLYVAGGEGGDAEKVYVFDPSEQKWSVHDAALPEPRAGLAVVAAGGKLFAIGGRFSDGQVTGRVDILDPADTSWQSGPALPEPRAGHAATVADNSVHVVGGEQDEPLQTHASHYVLASGAARWRDAKPLPSPRHGLVLVAARGGVLAIGGASGPGFYTVFTEMDSVTRYTP